MTEIVKLNSKWYLEGGLTTRRRLQCAESLLGTKLRYNGTTYNWKSAKGLLISITILTFNMVYFIDLSTSHISLRGHLTSNRRNILRSQTLFLSSGVFQSWMFTFFDYILCTINWSNCFQDGFCCVISFDKYGIKFITVLYDSGRWSRREGFLNSRNMGHNTNSWTQW